MDSQSRTGKQPAYFLTITQFAKELILSRKTLLRAIASGELHAHRFGRQWRISRDDAAAFIAVRRI